MPDPQTDTPLLLLGRVEGKLDALIAQTAGMNDRLNGHDKRISSLEHWRAYIIGASAVSGALLSKAWDLLK